MPVLLFSLSAVGVSRVHDILTCLAKFNEDVSLEATTSELRISSLNTSRTAHAVFTLTGNQFFEKYHYAPDSRGNSASSAALTAKKVWVCKLQNKALSSVFWRRHSANTSNGGSKAAGGGGGVIDNEPSTTLERCDLELQARTDQPECRLVFRLICRSGVVKTYRLTYETGEVLHATFDKSSSLNTWSVSAKTLRDVVEYFGPKTEQLDWYLQDGKVTFTSYTEKIQNGREILKQPMHTSVALEQQDFNDCSLEDGLHIGIMVKDFRAIVAHAESIQVNVCARYFRGNRPMQITYGHSGMSATFTLMTTGTSRIPGNTSGPTVATPVRNLSVRPVSRPQSANSRELTQVSTEKAASMAPPEKRTSLKRQLSNADEAPSRPQSPPPPTASINPDSLFIPGDGDDQQWDEPNYEEDADVITWDNTTESIDIQGSMRRIRDIDSMPATDVDGRRRENVFEIAPTQRLSQMKGMFD